MRQPSTQAPVAVATLVFVAMTAAACGHSSPAAPDAATAPPDAAATAPSATAAVGHGSGVTPAADARFPLSAGTFTISGRRGALSGIYSGETTESNGVTMTTLRLEVQSGTGNLSGATGVLNGTGSGAFTGEGAFSLAVSGRLATIGKKNGKFSESLKGWSNISCDGGRVIISLHADGHGTASGADLRHEVANAGCGF
jgi:hypothetical protein